MLKGFLQHNCTSFQINVALLTGQQHRIGQESKLLWLADRFGAFIAAKPDLNPRNCTSQHRTGAQQLTSCSFGKTPLTPSNVSFSKCHNQRKINFLSAMWKVRFKNHKGWPKLLFLSSPECSSASFSTNLVSCKYSHKITHLWRQHPDFSAWRSLKWICVPHLRCSVWLTLQQSAL